MLADVCRALTLVNPARTKQRLPERGITTVNTPTLNQFGAKVMQPMTYIDEANLYSGIFQSHKAEAEKFQDWVFEVVLRDHVDEEGQDAERIVHRRWHSPCTHRRVGDSMRSSSRRSCPRCHRIVRNSVLPTCLRV